MTENKQADNPYNAPACEACGCIGNNSCGAKAIKDNCRLDQTLICLCCATIGREANIKRWPKKAREE